MKYEGYYKNSLKHGSGNLTIIRKIKEETKEGPARYREDIYEYCGEFYKDKRHGHGNESYENGKRTNEHKEFTYEGFFKDNKKHGRGKMVILPYYYYDNETE